MKALLQRLCCHSSGRLYDVLAIGVLNLLYTTRRFTEVRHNRLMNGLNTSGRSYVSDVKLGALTGQARLKGLRGRLKLSRQRYVLLITLVPVGLTVLNR